MLHSEAKYDFVRGELKGCLWVSLAPRELGTDTLFPDWFLSREHFHPRFPVLHFLEFAFGSADRLSNPKLQLLKELDLVREFLLKFRVDGHFVSPSNHRCTKRRLGHFHARRVPRMPVSVNC